jgi:hypothetical protein
MLKEDLFSERNEDIDFFNVPAGAFSPAPFDAHHAISAALCATEQTLQASVARSQL